MSKNSYKTLDKQSQSFAIPKGQGKMWITKTLLVQQKQGYNHGLVQLEQKSPISKRVLVLKKLKTTLEVFPKRHC